MLSAQKTRSGVPTEQQSVLPTVRGVPWWGAVLIAGVPTVVGAVIDGSGQNELATTFRVLYFIGCVAAVLSVRRRSLFTAVTQPPLVAFGIAVVTFYLVKPGSSSGLKDLIINVLLPIAKLFPLMAWTFVVVLVLGVGRWFLTRTADEDAPRSTARRRADRPSATSRPRTSRSDSAGARSGSRSRTARDGDGTEADTRSRRRETPSRHSSPRDAPPRTSRRSSDEPTRVTPPARRRVESPTGARESMRPPVPRDRDRDRDNLSREPRPRPTGHRRFADGPPAEPGRDQPPGRLQPRRPRPDPLDDLRPPSTPRARYRGVNP